MENPRDIGIRFVADLAILFRVRLRGARNGRGRKKTGVIQRNKVAFFTYRDENADTCSFSKSITFPHDTSFYDLLLNPARGGGDGIIPQGRREGKKAAPILSG